MQSRQRSSSAFDDDPKHSSNRSPRRRRQPSPSRSRSPRRRRYDDDVGPEGLRRQRHRSRSRNPRTSPGASSRSASPRRQRRHGSASPSSRHRHSSDLRRPRTSRGHERTTSRSPDRGSRAKHRSPPRSRKPLPSQAESYRGGSEIAVGEPPKPKEKPNFKPSGLLAAETNKVTVAGGTGKKPQSIVLKYHEPPEARKPPSSEAWSLYVFKGDSKDPLETFPLHTRSCWLFGRETAVADVPIEHPSCSKQHAVFQFRHTVKKDDFGERRGKVGLYVLDLESANGTFLNGDRVDAARYVQIISGDVVKFGDSEREYVVLLPAK